MASSHSFGSRGGKGGDQRVANPCKVYIGGVHGHVHGKLLHKVLEDILGVQGVTQCYVTRE